MTVIKLTSSQSVSQSSLLHFHPFVFARVLSQSASLRSAPLLRERARTTLVQLHGVARYLMITVYRTTRWKETERGLKFGIPRVNVSRRQRVRKKSKRAENGKRRERARNNDWRGGKEVGDGKIWARPRWMLIIIIKAK